jgi:hypothetical protein
VQKKKINKKIRSDLDCCKWNKQQTLNFEQFGDPYYQEPYKYYNIVDITPPVANLPLQ